MIKANGFRTTARSISGSILPAFALLIALTCFANPAHAKGKGGYQLGGLLGFVNSSQDDMNNLISRANLREGGINTSQLNSAYEGAAQFGYRFSGSMIELLFRPSYFYSSQTGSGSSGSFNYAVTGFSAFPMFRIYPLENKFMKFFLQLGLGYGRANGLIEEGTAKVEFAGSSFGSSAGLGAEFCYTDSHCAVLEGNYRYLLMERNIASSATGTFATGTNGSIDPPSVNGEVELNNTDLQTKMSGIQFMLGYAFHF